MPSSVPAMLTSMVLFCVLFDAAVPFHWLPFVVLTREQRWSFRGLACVTVLGGLARVASSLLVGIVLGTPDEALVGRFGPFAEAANWTGLTLLLLRWLLGPATLLLLGLWLVFRATFCPRAGGDEQERDWTPDEGGCHAGAAAGIAPTYGSVTGSHREGGNIAAGAGLVMLMLLSPSVELREYALYFAAQPWATILNVSALWLVAWLSLQLLIVCSATALLNRIRHPWSGRHEGAIHGAVLIVLGLLWLFV